MAILWEENFDSYTPGERPLGWAQDEIYNPDTVLDKVSQADARSLPNSYRVRAVRVRSSDLPWSEDTSLAQTLDFYWKRGPEPVVLLTGTLWRFLVYAAVPSPDSVIAGVSFDKALFPKTGRLIRYWTADGWIDSDQTFSSGSGSPWQNLKLWIDWEKQEYSWRSGGAPWVKTSLVNEGQTVHDVRHIGLDVPNSQISIFADDMRLLEGPPALGKAWNLGRSSP